MKNSAVSQAKHIAAMLRKIAGNKDTLKVKLDKFLKVVSKKLDAKACAIYMAIDDMYFELVSEYGFAKDAPAQTSFRRGDGLVGEVAAHRRPISSADNVVIHQSAAAQKIKQKYKYFLGVPLVHASNVIGVLTLQNTKKTDYSKLYTEVLETIAMLLNDLISSEEMNDLKKAIVKERGLASREKFKGISLSRGYGMGCAVVHRRRQAVNKIFAEDKQKEQERLLVAHTQMNQDLDEKFEKTQLGIGEHTDILDAYRMFAKDKGWLSRIKEHIDAGLTAEAAIERSYEDMWNRLSATNDAYLKERLTDLRNVADRLQSYLSGDNKTNSTADVADLIIVAQTLGPAELMDYDYTKIRGLIIEEGTPTMHVAIVAKALNIPMLARVQGLAGEIKNGDLVALDGNEGYVYPKPSEIVQNRFKEKIADIARQNAKMDELKKLPSKTKDGVKVNLYINVGLNFDYDYLASPNCDGVGLFRTEIPFMASDKMPDVAAQVEYYKKLMDKAGRKKVVFRSLDVGSDKRLPYWSSISEENPAIGWRSIRISLDRRAILRQQIRAFLRSAVDKELNIMFPMISNLSEFEDAKETVLIELEKERRRSGAVPKKVNFGLMIEVPVLIFQLDAILDKADFISIGTNDLAQFAFACDRGNPRLLERYDVLSAPFLKMLEQIVKKADEKGVYCSVCGEMAGNPLEALVLIGLGYRNLSMSGSSLGRVKSMVRTVNAEDVADYVKNILQSNKKTLRPQLLAYAYDHGIEIS